jgi:hypothetical protein
LVVPDVQNEWFSESATPAGSTNLAALREGFYPARSSVPTLPDGAIFALIRPLIGDAPRVRWPGDGNRK